MKRRFIKLTVFVLLGAIVNVAVAWGCAIHNTSVSLDSGFPCWGEEPFIREPFPMRSFENEHVIWIDDVWPVPIDPLWPSFAINTVFYAVILWVVFAAPFALRRRRRIRRGLCPVCAYPVGDSEVCTECGHSLSPRERARVRGDTS